MYLIDIIEFNCLLINFIVNYTNIGSPLSLYYSESMRTFNYARSSFSQTALHVMRSIVGIVMDTHQTKATAI